MADDADADVTNDAEDGPPALSVGGYDVLRFDALNDIPGLSSGIALLNSTRKVQDENDYAELGYIAADLADIGINIAVYAMDPLNWLLTAGLTFLVDVVQPLEDLLALVTGHPERMEAEMAKWLRVGVALGPLAQEIRDAADKGLVGWQGKAAEAAKERLHQFADGVESLTHDVRKLEIVMGMAKTLMEVAQQFILSLIATFIEWLIFTWTPALAAAAPTFGASTAAAGAATEAEAGVTFSRATSFLNRVMMILKRFKTLVERMERQAMDRVQTEFQPRINGRFSKGWVTSDIPLRKVATDWRTVAPPIIKGGVSAVDATRMYVETQGPDLSDDELDKALGGE